MLRVLEAIRRRDVAALQAEVTPDFELHPLVTVWTRTYVGHSGVEAWQRDLAGLWDEFAIDLDDLRTPGGDALVVVGRWRGTPRDAAAPMEGPIAAVIRFEGDKVKSADVFLHEAEAEAAAKPAP